jgi:hypothetical protein
MPIKHGKSVWKPFFKPDKLSLSHNVDACLCAYLTNNMNQTTIFPKTHVNVKRHLHFLTINNPI